MAVMGSGGHTQEMITLLSHLNIGSINGKYSPITLIASKDDHLSVNKAKQMTQSLSDCQLVSITRSRSVGQSYWTSVVTTMISVMESLVIVWKVRPKLVVCNGPGVCVPICLVAKLLNRIVVSLRKNTLLLSYL
ncbi:unnamed protein product [Oppiella nova]|uniref:UDP-N-acetylglucosamine transferase subunit ALG14 n=1 Tax=Oppiella nova TaxID=334625 RepID=A0A7R9MRX3_9ACAR|nr:unnamed protein product [Oppiella nova]CAG2182423.1 unnamed protein product [Oppiella nova]